MYGDVTSRNHQAYSWGHLVLNNTDYINIVAVCGFAISEIIFFKNSSSFFLKLGKLDKEVIWTGREFQIFGPW